MSCRRDSNHLALCCYRTDLTALKRVFNAAYPGLDAAETTARQRMASRLTAIRALPVGQKANDLGDMMVYHTLVACTETGAAVTF